MDGAATRKVPPLHPCLSGVLAVSLGVSRVCHIAFWIDRESHFSRVVWYPCMVWQVSVCPVWPTARWSKFTFPLCCRPQSLFVTICRSCAREQRPSVRDAGAPSAPRPPSWVKGAWPCDFWACVVSRTCARRCSKGANMQPHGVGARRPQRTALDLSPPWLVQRKCKGRYRVLRGQL